MRLASWGRGLLCALFIHALGDGALFNNVLSAADEARTPQKFALLVGVDQYSDLNQLKCASRDQWALADRLQAYGFPDDQIIVLASQTHAGQNNDDVKRLPIQRNILKWLGNTIDLTRKGDMLLVAFSGHGIQIGERNYLCPVDADPDDPQHTMVDIDLLNAKLKVSDATLKLLILDACRDDPRPPGKRSAQGDVRFDYGLPPDGVVSIKSCSRGKTAHEDANLGGGHGVFMHFLLQGLDGKAAGDDGTVTLGRLFEYASRETDKYVVKEFGDVQRPVIFPENVERVALVRSSDRRAVPPPTALARPKMPAPSAIPAQDVKPGKVITNSIGMKLAAIPAGEFLMGSAAGDSTDEKPQHRVRITRPFYLGVYEVTQEEYQQVMGKNPSEFSSTGDYKKAVQGMDSRRFPVENLSWEDAEAFCRKLSQREGKTYRLPTEAEWEYACRAGTTSDYYTGDGEQALTAAGWNNRNSNGRTNQVGQKQPNGFGLYDMHGNVWEWCADWYDASYYANSPVDDPQGPPSGSYRVFRGGGWDSLPVSCRSANRDWYDPSFRYYALGFRVALASSE